MAYTVKDNDGKTNTTEISTVLLDASKEVGLDLNKEKIKYMFMSRHQNAAQDRNVNEMPIKSL
jgi:hypothetical protein